MLLIFSDTKRTLMHLLLFTTAINFPCIITLIVDIYNFFQNYFKIVNFHSFIFLFNYCKARDITKKQSQFTMLFGPA